MRKLITILLLFISFVTKAQFPRNTPTSDTSTNTINAGAYTANKGFGYKVYSDTTTINFLSYTKTVPGITVATSGGVLWQRNYNATRWIQVSAPCNGLQPNTGIVTWSGIGLTFNATTAIFCINGNSYTALGASTTLATADPSLGRFDVIYADTAGLIGHITGTPSATPAVPQVDGTKQVYLTNVFVGAGATTPGGITQKIVYDENTEWATSSFGTITAVFTDTHNPYHLVKDIQATSIALSSGLQFTNSTTVNQNDYSILNLHAASISGTGGTADISLTSGGVPVTSKVPITISSSTSYQNISIPLSSFMSPTSPVGGYLYDGVRIVFSSANSTGVFIDYINLQGGIPTGGGNYVTNVFRKTATDSLFQTINGINYFVSLIDTSAGGGGSGGLHKVYAGNGLVNVNDSTLRADTTVLKTVLQARSDSLALAATTATKQPQLNGTGFVKATGTTITYDNTAYGTGTVTSVATGYGLLGGTISTTGTLVADSATLSNYYKRQKDSTNPITGYTTLYQLGLTNAQVTANTAAITAKKNITDSTNSITGYTTLYQNSLKLNKTDTANKWVNSVTSVNDSVIRVFKGASSTDLLIRGSGGGGSAQNLQQVSNLGNITTKSLYSADSINALSFHSDGGEVIGDSTALSTDSTIFYGASIEVGLNASPSTNRWTTLVSQAFNTTETNKAISSTSFSQVSAGDSSFMNRLYTVPNYRSTIRYLVIGCSNILNENFFHTGISVFSANLARAIDTIKINRGFPSNSIVVSMPGMIGINAFGDTNDSLRLYVQAAISICVSKGIQYVDNFTYTTNNGANSLLSSDSLHPNNAGHYQLSQGFRFRVSDAKFMGSVDIQRNLLVKSSQILGNKLTMLNTTPGTTGNFSGKIGWGTAGNVDGSALEMLNFNNSTKSEIGYINNTGQSYFSGRSDIDAGLMLGVGVYGKTPSTVITPSNANIYLSDGSSAASANGKFTVLNGTNKIAIASPNLLSMPATVGNTAGVLNWGAVAANCGIRPLGSSAGTSAGFIYKGTTGEVYIFGRGTFPTYFGNGKDETNMDSTNASFYINPSNLLTANGLYSKSRVGILNAAPAEALDVKGNIRDSAGYFVQTPGYFTPTTGSTITTTVGDNIIEPAGAILALTINLPSSPSNGMKVHYTITQAITTLTFANGTTVNPISTSAAGGEIGWQFYQGTGQWYKY